MPYKQNPIEASYPGMLSGEPTDEERNSVATPSLAYITMAQRWVLLETLMGGTLAMQAAGKTFLPQEPKETGEAYEARLKRSVLYEAFKDTVKKTVAKPFSHPVEFPKKGLGEHHLRLLSSSDRAGTDASTFFKGVFEDAIIHGLTHVLIDYPVEPGDSLADARERDIRPYFTHITAPQLIGWRFDGEELAQIRIKETRIEYVGFAEQAVEHVRVFNSDGSWELWRELEKREGEYDRVAGGMHTYPGIPLVSFYTDKTGRLAAVPPLEPLGWLNLGHWHSDSDQRNILRFSRFGILFGRGFTEEDLDAIESIGPNQFIHAANENADLKVVEHLGTAIESGRKDLKDLEERMEILGLQPLITPRESAFARKTHKQENDSAIQTWIYDLESMIIDCFNVASTWIGKDKVPEDWRPIVFSDFINPLSTADMAALDKAVEKGWIKLETYLAELKRRSVLSERVNIEEEIKNASEATGNKSGNDPGESEGTLPTD